MKYFLFFVAVLLGIVLVGQCQSASLPTTEEIKKSIMQAGGTCQAYAEFKDLKITNDCVYCSDKFGNEVYRTCKAY